MATIILDKKTGYWQIRFRFGGRRFQRSLGTEKEVEADRTRARLEDTISLIEKGRIELPPHADLVTFLLSDGKLLDKPVAPQVQSPRKVNTTCRLVAHNQ